MSERVEHIVCAIRGSTQSPATVTHAIDLALASNARWAAWPTASRVESTSRCFRCGPRKKLMVTDRP